MAVSTDNVKTAAVTVTMADIIARRSTIERLGWFIPDSFTLAAQRGIGISRIGRGGEQGRGCQGMDRVQIFQKCFPCLNSLNSRKGKRRIRRQ